MRATTFAVVAVSLVACSKSVPETRGCGDGPACSGGQVCIAASCRDLCSDTSNCGSGFICASGVCVPDTSVAAPEIISVDGTGSIDGATGHTNRHLRDRLVIVGNNLQGATARLQIGGSAVDLIACEEPTDHRLAVALPTDIQAGTYTLTVANQAGSCDASLSLLQGEPGDLAELADIPSSAVAFNYAGSASKGGAALDLACSGCVSGEDIADGSVGLVDLGPSGCAPGLVMKRGATAWECLPERGSDDGEGYVRPGSPLTMGIEGRFLTCAQNDRTSVGCRLDDGWPVVCHRTDAEMAASADQEGFSSFMSPAAYWANDTDGWLATGRGTGGPCASGVVMFNPVAPSGTKADPTHLKWCARTDSGSIGCRPIVDGWPVVCVRNDNSANLQRGGWMVHDAHFMSGEWRGIVRGSGGPCTHGVWFWDYKD